MIDQDPLIDTNERLLFRILAPLSILVWAGIIVGTFGAALLVLLLGFLVYLFAQSWLICHLRGTGAIVSARQFPDLGAHLTHCLDRLGMAAKPPEMILIHADGMFNALATRFLRRNYVVLFSDVVDALADEPEATRFYIGHELGHIRRGHLIWGPVLAVLTWLPLVGAGYSRAREYTCDLHGLACCPDKGAAMRAMAALAVGGERWKTLDMPAYLEQVGATGGFWMSFHEIVGNYPWLTKRIARLEGTRAAPHRNPGAWLLGLFIPQLSLASLAIIYLAILGPIMWHDIQTKTQETESPAAAAVDMEQFGLDDPFYEDVNGHDFDGNFASLPQPHTPQEYEVLPVGTTYVHPAYGIQIKANEQEQE